MSTTPVNIILLLDRSGSMESMGKEPVQAINTFIKGQQAEQGRVGTITLYTFANSTECVFRNVPLAECKEFKDYKPDGSTALYDSISQAIETADKSVTTIMVIVTDGQDNASKTKSKDIKDKMKEMRDKHKWQIIFLAKGEDAFSEGDNLCLSSATKFGSAKGSMETAVRMLSTGVNAFCRGSSTKVEMNSQP